jgi:hypothetical protein
MAADPTELYDNTCVLVAIRALLGDPSWCSRSLLRELRGGTGVTHGPSCVARWDRLARGAGLRYLPYPVVQLHASPSDDAAHARVFVDYATSSYSRTLLLSARMRVVACFGFPNGRGHAECVTLGDAARRSDALHALLMSPSSVQRPLFNRRLDKAAA